MSGGGYMVPTSSNRPTIYYVGQWDDQDSRGGR